MMWMFWLALLPFSTSVMWEYSFSSGSVAGYAFVLTMCLVLYRILVRRLHHLYGTDSQFLDLLNENLKSNIILGLNLSAVVISVIGFPVIAFLPLIFVAFIWFVPAKQLNIKIK